MPFYYRDNSGGADDLFRYLLDLTPMAIAEHGRCVVGHSDAREQDCDRRDASVGARIRSIGTREWATVSI